MPGSMVTGAVASWYKLRPVTSTPFAAAALIVYCRLINTTTILVIGLLGLAADVGLVSSWFRLAAAAVLAGMVFALAPFVSPRAARVTAKLASVLAERLPLPASIPGRARTAWRAVAAFHQLGPRGVARIFGLSLLSNAIGVLVWYVLATAVGIQLPVAVIGWVSAVLAIIQLIPVSIAGLGVREATLVLLLGRYGIPAAQALSFSLTIFGLTAVLGAAGGLLEAGDTLRLRFSRGVRRKISEKPSARPPEPPGVGDRAGGS
jgi:hypothetical protein